MIRYHYAYGLEAVRTAADYIKQYVPDSALIKLPTWQLNEGMTAVYDKALGPVNGPFTIYWSYFSTMNVAWTVSKQ